MITKPWGYEEIIIKTNKYVLKLLHIQQGKRLSLQYHNVKEETMYIIKGVVEIQWGQMVHIKLAGEHSHIPPKCIHRVTAVTDADIFEVSTPELDDIVRLEDDYGRA